MLALAGLLCLLAPLLVATDAPGPARLIVSLLFFSLTPGVAALSLGRHQQSPPKLEAGMVIGTSLALSTLLAWLMLSLHAWQPEAALYAVAGVCLLTLALGARQRSQASAGGGYAPGTPHPSGEDEQHPLAPQAAERPSRGQRLRTPLQPTWVSEFELAAPIVDLCPPGGPELEYARARILVRLHRQPLGFIVLAMSEGRLAAADILTGVREQLGEELARHLARDGLQGTPLLACGLPASLRPSCSTAGPHPLASPFASVVVCTRDRADSLARTLRSLLALRHDSFEIVVDNAPRTSATRELVKTLGEQRIRCVLEAQPGLSRARNRGVAAARGEIVAFTDDDVVVDSEWLAAIVRGFTRARGVGCVTGMVPAAELETQAQAYFDSKLDWAESCEARLFDLHEHRPQDDRTYPYSAGLFGAGANFAIRKSVFAAVGSFDEALGVGSPSRGGEDLDYFLRVVLSGRIIAYEPAALVWHLHRRENDALVLADVRLRRRADGLCVQAPALHSRCGGGASCARSQSRWRTSRAITTRHAAARRLRGAPCSARREGCSPVHCSMRGLAGSLARTPPERTPMRKLQPAVEPAPSHAPASTAGWRTWSYRARADRSSPPDRSAPRLLTWRVAAPHLLLIAAALSLWLLAIAHTNLSHMSGAGLASALPLEYYLAIALLIVGFATAVYREPLPTPVLALYLLALVLAIHGTAPLVYQEPRYAWLYKHIGVTELLASTGSIHPAYDIYNNWPGFFALAAWLERVGGLSPLAFAGWAQVYFNLINAAALQFALRGLTRDRRLIWIATWIFLLGNWVGQDYYSPQALGFIFALIAIGVALRTFGSRPLPTWLARRLDRMAAADAPPPTPADLKREATAPSLTRGHSILVGGGAFLAVLITHQLSPVVLILSIIALVFVRRIPLWVPAALVALEALWLWHAWSFLSNSIALLSPGGLSTARPLGFSGEHMLPAAGLASVAARAVSLLIVLIATAEIVRRVRKRRLDATPVLLAIVPALIVGIQSYGGEVLFRAYLFSLPWLAFLVASWIINQGSSPLRRRSIRLALVSFVLAATMLVAYFGLDLGNRIDRGDVQAAVWYEKNAPAGSARWCC